MNAKKMKEIADNFKQMQNCQHNFVTRINKNATFSRLYKLCLRCKTTRYEVKDV